MSRRPSKKQDKKCTVTVGVDEGGTDEIGILTLDLTGTVPPIWARMPIAAVPHYLKSLKGPQEDPRNSLEAWQRITADVCGGCGLRKLDAAGVCGACGKQKVRAT